MPIQVGEGHSGRIVFYIAPHTLVLPNLDQQKSRHDQHDGDVLPRLETELPAATQELSQ